MLFTGYVPIIIVKVKNKTNEVIERINITYDGCKYKAPAIKKIKPNERKQVPIATVNLGTSIDLKMFINEDLKYVIKEKVREKDKYNLNIIISKVDYNGALEFTSEIETEEI